MSTFRNTRVARDVSLIFRVVFCWCFVRDLLCPLRCLCGVEGDVFCCFARFLTLLTTLEVRPVGGDLNTKAAVTSAQCFRRRHRRREWVVFRGGMRMMCSERIRHERMRRSFFCSLN